MNGFRPSVMMGGLDNSSIKLKPASPTPPVINTGDSGKPKTATKMQSKKLPVEPSEPTESTESTDSVSADTPTDDKKTPIKTAILEFLKKQKTPVKPADIWSGIIKKNPDYKKNALYAALRDTKKFEKTEDGKESFYSIAKGKK